MEYMRTEDLTQGFHGINDVQHISGDRSSLLSILIQGLMSSAAISESHPETMFFQLPEHPFHSPVKFTHKINHHS